MWNCDAIWVASPISYILGFDRHCITNIKEVTAIWKIDRFLRLLTLLFDRWPWNRNGMYLCLEAWVLNWNGKVQFPTTAQREGNLQTLRWFLTSITVFKPKKGNSIRFYVDETIFVAGYGPELTDEVKVNIGDKRSAEGTILRQKVQKISGDRSCNIIQALFDCPVRIKANMYYTYFMVNWAHFTNLTCI